MALLTDARNGLWQAIDNWPALKLNAGDAKATVFRKTFRFDSDAPHQRMVMPSLSEMPCLAIRSVQVDPQWINNRQQGWPIAYLLTMWTAHWVLAQPEGLFEDVMNALYRSVNGSNVEYVRAATGYPVMSYGDVSFEPIEMGEQNGIKAIRTSWTVGLRTTKDPFSG
jgi:hypothetical protein